MKTNQETNGEVFACIEGTEPMTDLQVESAIQGVNWYYEDRQKKLGKEFSPCDFVCGAMVVFAALGSFDKVPMVWHLFPPVGRSIVDGGPDGLDKDKEDESSDNLSDWLDESFEPTS